MRFVLRGVTGILLAVAALAMLAFGAWRLMDARQDAASGPQRPSAERAFTVNVAPFETETISPTITAYGEIRSWRTLELRATSGGRLVEVVPELRDGAAAHAGDLLFAIDPADAESRRADAEAALADARAELAEAEVSVRVAEQERANAERQEALREQALARQEQLKERGFGSDAAVEAAQMDAQSAEQAVLTKEQALIAAQNRVERAALAIRRAEIALAETDRIVRDTRVAAPFDGLLSEVNAVLGRLVSENEKLAVLIDPSALEAVFRVSNAQFARLIDDRGVLKPTPVLVRLELGGVAIDVSGHVERAAATVGEGQTGRVVYARLDVDADTILRDGDFVIVTIEEPPLENVARIPAAAATEDGRMLVVGDESRLEEVRVQIVRRQGDDLIVAGGPQDADYVTERQPQLGPGILVQPANRAKEAVADAALPHTGAAEDERITLTSERRDALISFLKANSRMPDERRIRLLDLVSQPEVPKKVVDQIEQRMGQRS